MIADHTLCNFTFVVRKQQVHSATMYIKLGSRGIWCSSQNIQYAIPGKPSPQGLFHRMI